MRTCRGPDYGFTRGGSRLAAHLDVHESVAARERPELPAALRWAIAIAPPIAALVAEDNELNSELMQQLLVSHGHDVHLATTGREALQLAASEHFDVLLLDVDMPELDGFSVAQAIRDRENGFIAKPIDAAELWAAIDRFAGAAKRLPSS